jgi:hypothetical protein
LRAITRLAIVCSIVAVTLSVAAPANAESFTFYSDRAAFLAAVGRSITDDYSGYGVATGAAPGQFSDAAMSAVLGETAYKSTPSNQNLVGDVYRFGDKTNYCPGCNGNFQLSFGNTSLSVGDGVFGVGVNIVLHTSRRSAIGDVIPGDPSLDGTVLVEFTNGEVLAVTVPADVGFFGPEIHFLGVTDQRGIESLTFGIEPLSRLHFWAIDDLTIAAVPEPASILLLGTGLGVITWLVRRRATRA